MKRFGLIGVAGYVAPRHLKAISETKNKLVACLDPNDSVGIIDSYFPGASFFTEFERFDRHIYKVSTTREKLDYISICSPNYLHDAHIRFGLRSDCDVICEKPLVVNPWNLDGIQSIEESSGRKLNAILQLRVHPNVLRLKGKVERELSETKKVIDLTYITPRGRWYDVSWKGVLEKSGGIVTNIGVHFFDMLGWIYGDVQDSQVYHRQPKSASGVLEYNDAVVNWYLSTDGNDLSLLNKDSTKPFRSLTIDDEEFDFSLGFNDLHTLSYEQILLGNGFGVEDSRPSIETVFDIKTMKIRDSKDGHWFLRKKGGA